MTITALPTAPARSDPPATFITRADALLAALSTLVTEVNAATQAMNLNATSDTSASSVAIGTGAKTFTVSAGKSFLGGMFLVIADTAAPSTNAMYGRVTSYSGTTLVMSILAVIGSGTKTAWTISQSAPGGAALGANADITSLTACTIISALLSTPFVQDIQDFRLTLTSGTPVTTADVTGATTLYCAPYKGNSIALYDGTRWNVRQSAQFSLALGTLTSGKPYDVFCYDNAGTPTLEFLAWTNDTTRATALVYQDGVLVKTGQTTRRYLGTFYTTAATTTEDSVANRYLWNYYNRCERGMYAVDSTDNWTYTTATFREARNVTTNRLNFVVGVSEDAINVSAANISANSTINVNMYTGIGVDSTSTAATGCVLGYGASQVTNGVVSTFAQYNGVVSAGKHYAARLEASAAAGTCTWYGDAGSPGLIQSGITGRVLA